MHGISIFGHFWPARMVGVELCRMLTVNNEYFHYGFFDETKPHDGESKFVSYLFCNSSGSVYGVARELFLLVKMFCPWYLKNIDWQHWKYSCMLVTFQSVNNIIICQNAMSVTDIWYWWRNLLPTSKYCHQHIWSPTSVTNIDLTHWISCFQRTDWEGAPIILTSPNLFFGHNNFRWFIQTL